MGTALPGALERVWAFSLCWWESVLILHCYPLHGYCFLLFKMDQKLAKAATSSEKLWLGGSCEQTCTVQSVRKFSVVTTLLNWGQGGKREFNHRVCNRRGSFTQVLGISTGTVFWWVTRPRLWLLFCLLFVLGKSDLNSLELYFFESQKEGERIATWRQNKCGLSSFLEQTSQDLS